MCALWTPCHCFTFNFCILINTVAGQIVCMSFYECMCFAYVIFSLTCNILYTFIVKCTETHWVMCTLNQVEVHLADNIQVYF